MSAIADELAAIETEVADLGSKVERLRVRFAELLVGKIAVERSGKRFLIEKVRVYQGGSQYRLFVEGHVLTKDGKPHARSGRSSIVGMLAAIEPAPQSLTTGDSTK